MEAFDNLLGAGAARAFTENRHFGVKIVPWLEVRFGMTVLVDSFVIRLHADDPVPVEKNSLPANPVKMVMPAASTFSAIHFTNLLMEMT